MLVTYRISGFRATFIRHSMKCLVGFVHNSYLQNNKINKRS